MRPIQFAQPVAVSGLCAHCGIPADSKYFDESGIADVPGAGSDAVLATFQLRPQYCGVLEYFAQYTDTYGRDMSRIETRGLQWVILSNRQVLYPYTKLEHIVNPWGYGSFQIALRLNEGATIEFVVRCGREAVTDITRVGGRIVGRYWYNAAYGGPSAGNGR